MLRKIKLWWIGYRIRHLEALYDEATEAMNYAAAMRVQCRSNIQRLKARAMSEVM